MTEQTQTTTLNRGWVLKMTIIAAVLAGLGVWGLLDGLWIYPNRGEKDASIKLRDYLAAARDANQLTRDDVVVNDPAARLADLESRERELQRIASGETISRTTSPRAAKMELARLEWLRSLKKVWRLGSAPGRVEDDPAAQLAALETFWKTETPPKPLSGMDLMFQWVFVVAGFGGTAWLLTLMLRAKGRKFRWDPREMRLTLPDGMTIVPGDVREFDRRLWHKFYMLVHLKTGRTLKVDLLRHVPLEQWVLEMERTVHPPEAADAPETEAPAHAAPPAEEPATAAGDPDRAEGVPSR